MKRVGIASLPWRRANSSSRENFILLRNLMAPSMRAREVISGSTKRSRNSPSMRVGS
jgi:hypothetical protein